MTETTAYDARDDLETFRRMAREFPVRTGVFSFGLPLFAVLQLVNGYLHGGSLPIIAAFGAVAVVFSLQLTSYHVAVYRRERIDRRWVDEGRADGDSPGRPG